MRSIALGFVVLVVLLLPTAASAQTPGVRVFVPVASRDTAPTAIATLPPTAIPTSVPIATPSPPSATPTRTASPTPVPPTATPPPVLVVFLQGLRTTSASQGFDGVKTSLTQAGWSPGQFVDYSYRGGAWSAGGWQPNYYGCGDSLEGVAESKRQLAATLVALRAAQPGSRFVLVGHSFGGLTALAYAAESGDPSLAGVFTIDSPLDGVGGKSTLLDLYPCLSAQGRQSEAVTVAISDLQDMFANGSAWAAYWRGAASRLTSAGLALLTLGNSFDCVYWPSRTGCSIPWPFSLFQYSDDRWTQYVPGYDWRCDADAAGWFETHSAMLRSPECVAALTVRIGLAAQPR